MFPIDTSKILTDEEKLERHKIVLEQHKERQKRKSLFQEVLSSAIEKSNERVGEVSLKIVFCAYSDGFTISDSQLLPYTDNILDSIKSGVVPYPYNLGNELLDVEFQINTDYTYSQYMDLKTESIKELCDEVDNDIVLCPIIQEELYKMYSNTK